MELILSLEQNFQKINAKLSSNKNVNLINNKHDKDCDRINQIFSSSKQGKYENGLNDCCGELIKQMIQFRDKQLKEVDDFIGKNNLEQLKNLADTIKSEYLAFDSSLISVFQSILCRFNLDHPLNLGKLVKYAPLLNNEEKINITKAIDLLEFDYFPEFYVHILPFNQLLLCFNSNRSSTIEKFELLILDKNRDVIHSKLIERDLKQWLYYEDTDQWPNINFKVNATQIIFNDLVNLRVEIYNFDLKLFHTFKLIDLFHNNFKVNNYEIAFFDDYLINIYDYKTTRTKSFINSLQVSKLDNKCNNFYLEEFSFDLLGFNDKFFFINATFNDCRKFHFFILNRNDITTIYRSVISQESNLYYMYNTDVFFRETHDDRAIIKVYSDFSLSDIGFRNANSRMVETLITRYVDNYDCGLHELYPTSNYKCIYAKYIFEIIKEKVGEEEDNEYENYLKFRHY